MPHLVKQLQEIVRTKANNEGFADFREVQRELRRNKIAYLELKKRRK
mgnify:CR=1 FL=1